MDRPVPVVPTVDSVPFPAQNPIDDGGAVADEPFVDDDFHDDAEWMDVNLQQDAAVSPRGKNLLQNFGRALNMNICSAYRERGFDVALHVHFR